VIDVAPWIKKLTVDIIGTSALAQEFDTLSDKVNQYYHHYELMNQPSILLFLLPFYSKLPIKRNAIIKNSSQKLIEMSREYINNRKKENKHECLIDMMINSDMSEWELINNVYLFFLAGHETTASALGWIINYLAKYPEVQEKMRAEILSVVGEGSLTLEHTKQLDYTEMVIKEVMRLRPPAAQIIGRLTTQEVKIGSLVIPPQTSVSVSVYAIHHHPDFWPDPEKFDPERFSPKNCAGRHPYAYLPFSLGKRHCIGLNFSLLEQKAFLAMFMQKYVVEYVQDAVAKDHFVLMSPKNVVVKVLSRKPSGVKQP